MFEKVSLEFLKYRNSAPNENEVDICALNSKQSERTCQIRVEIGSTLVEFRVKILLKMISKLWSNFFYRILCRKIEVKNGIKSENYLKCRFLSMSMNCF